MNKELLIQQLVKKRKHEEGVAGDIEVITVDSDSKMRSILQ